jgi:hypothetical protein
MGFKDSKLVWNHFWSCSLLDLWFSMMWGNLDIQVMLLKITQTHNGEGGGRDMKSFASVWCVMFLTVFG